MAIRAPECLLGVPHNTQTPTKKTPFKLVFSTEAVILVEVGLTNLGVGHYNEDNNDKELCINLDLLNEVRIGVEQCPGSVSKSHD